jgi:hypothetical protein
MAVLTSREDLVSYIKRRLGYPVVEINIDDDQVDDRIDDALQFYQEYHFDAIEKVYLSHTITPSNLTFTTASTGTFENNEIIRTAANVAIGQVYTQANATVLQVRTSNGSFAAAQVVTGDSSGATGTIASVALGDIDNRYIATPPQIMGVVTILNPMGVFGSSGMFDMRYQMALNDMHTFTSASVIPYYQLRAHLSLLNELFNGTPMIRWQRHQNRLSIDWDWSTDASPGMKIVIEAWRILDPDTYTDVWNDRFLKDYAAALCKKQWGQNLKKFDGVQLPNGVTLNGDKIYADGEKEIEELQRDMQSRFEVPPGFMIG